MALGKRGGNIILQGERGQNLVMPFGKFAERQILSVDAFERRQRLGALERTCHN